MKRIISCLILCAMLLTIIPVSVSAAATVDPDSTWYGDGTAEVFEISDAADLQAFNNALTGSDRKTFEGKTVRLTASISATGVVWDGTGAFKGTFDGQNHTISDLTITVTEDNSTNYTSTYGMFGIAQGTIQNFTLQGVKSDFSGKSHVGAVVGARIYGNNKYTGNLTITNVHVVNGSVSGAGQVGGILANTNSGTAGSGNVLIENCSFNGTVTGSGSRVGGLVGYAVNAAKLSITDCVVNTTAKGTELVGGFVGETKVPTTISDCYVDADIEATASSKAYAGGAIGGSQSVVNLTFTTSVSNTYINADITSADRAGGVIGEVVSTANSSTLAMKNTYVSGSMTSATTYSAGLAGWINANVEGKSITVNAENVIVNITGAKYGLACAHATSGTAGTEQHMSGTFTNVYYKADTADEAADKAFNNLSAVSGELYETFYDRTNFSKTAAQIKALDLAGLETVAAMASKTSVIGYQTKDNGNGTYDVRFVLGIINPILGCLDRVGATVAVEANSKSADATTTKVYNSIVGGEETYLASNWGVDALYVIGITGIADATTFDAKVTPFAQANTFAGTPASFTSIAKGNTVP